MTTIELLQKTRAARAGIANAGAEEKNALLLAMAESLQAHCADILAANAEDMAAARGHITEVMLDRLRLDENRIAAMADGIRDTVKLPDHTGRVLSEVVRPNGIVIDKVQVPLGFVAIIYESRPNVTSDAAALAIKSGNVCMLRSGKEAFRSARAIVTALKAGIEKAGGNGDIVNIVEDTSHASAQELMTANGLVDLLIPRGGAGLIRACVENATVPCIETGTGICHVYVDRDADLQKALAIIVNAKTSRPSVCNAEEVCLVHRDIAEQFLPQLKKALVEDRQAAGLAPVELRLDPAAAKIIDGTAAGARDFDTEFLDYILAVGVADSLDAAIAHIAAHSTHHSDCIVTEDAAAAKKFTELVDSAAVYVNVSTRFTDGGEFGLGCEMGISTQKLHARGPMGLDELSTYKYVIRGDGQVR
ncbi:glutamate-5-semialdehyde dehydrogenase [Oscillibacter valericigenes]|nr:glutamate-5-semialdehyde dehydrogenase [Oscillibacter valericigenes]